MEQPRRYKRHAVCTAPPPIPKLHSLTCLLKKSLSHYILTCRLLPPILPVVALLPVLKDPSLDAKRLTLHSAIASSDNSTTPIVTSYWPGSEPRATGANDLVIISASVRFTTCNGNVIAFADASFINTIVAADDTGVVDPASDVTAIFHLTGMVTLIAPGEREFKLETGAWATEVCDVI